MELFGMNSFAQSFRNQNQKEEVIFKEFHSHLLKNFTGNWSQFSYKVHT